MSAPFAPASGAVAVATRPRLPAPTAVRWQPLRLGLVNLYRFDDEVFAFEDGRLLLRGNNGTGKSRVLALSLPFLFDGRLEPHRVEPDGDPAKRMEWNLLLGRYDDRLGYAWLEFGRRTEAGVESAPPAQDGAGALAGDGAGAPAGDGAGAPADNGGGPLAEKHGGGPLADWGTGPPAGDGIGAADRYLTIGCGMRATAGGGAPRTWFFVTDQRIGEDLRLIADTGQALTRERLAEAIGERGQVVESATEYRRLVDRALFGLGEHRYGALVDLLIQLRRPQLSRQLDESLLSAALSEALPPLPAAVIADVADAFRALDDDRDALEGFEAARDATATFLGFYRSYAAVAARLRASAVTQANARYERTRAELRDAERRRDEAATEVGRLETRRAELEEAERAAGVEVQTLEMSPEMEAARNLDQARKRARELVEAARERGEDLQRGEEQLARRVVEVTDAEASAETTRAEVATSSTRARAAAEEAGLAAAHARTLAPLGLPDARDADAAASARRALDDLVGRKRRAAEHLLELDAAVRTAAQELTAAKRRLGDREAELDHARDAAAEAETAVAAARAGATAALRAWAQALAVLGPIAVDEVADALEGWEGDGDGPIARAADRARAHAGEILGREAARLEDRTRALEAERAEVAVERDELASGGHRPPPVPYTRDAESRATRAGAPLWRLVDIRDGVDPDSASGFEAALEASGLLDAWVTPDGALVDADDTILIAAGTPVRDDGGLAAVLTPAAAPGDEPAARVPRDHVAALLARIGARGDGDVWVAADGRWRVGPLHGRWRKAAVEYLGHAARERARIRRLAELDARLADLDGERARLDNEAADVQRRVALADAERAAAPSEDALREAAFAVRHAAAEVRRHRERVAEAEADVEAHQAALDGAEAKRDAAAADLGLADRASDPAGLIAALDAYRAALAELWAAVRVHGRSLQALEEASEERRRAEEERDRRHAQARAALSAAADAATRLETLEKTVGQTAAEVVARLEAARERRQEVQERLRKVAAAREEHLLAREKAATELAIAEKRLEEHAAARSEHVESFRRLVRAGFLEVAGADVDVPPAETGWAADPAVRLARQVNDILSETSAGDEDWSRVQRGLHGHYTNLEHALLPRALQPTGTVDDGLFVVTTTFLGRTVSVPELHDLLADEVAQRKSMLDAREREVLENHLVGEIATQLHELIRNGENLVNKMNQELAARPTSTGMRLRFSWQPRPDGPEALPDARRRLLAADHVWSPEDRAALGAFLQARIHEVREAEESGTWQDHLTRALDYRSWHLFAVERQQDGRWTRLTRRTHGTGSGGEKALALTVPQFAAAAAHYRTADRRAPRLIALDEAFVGIDNDMRAKCLDLLVQFDLDVVMTSEREWACYPTVPAIAIYQFSTRQGIDAIGVHRWIWNGRDRLEVRAEAPQAP